MLNNIKNSRYLIGIICAFIAGGFFLFLQSAFSQTIFQNTIDLLNLEQVHPDITGAYLTPDKMGFKETWKLLNDNLLIPMTPVKIGIIDTRIDGTHPEFRGVDFGDTDELALTLPSVFRTSHGTAVAGIIGANNISATSSGNYIEPHMNGILSGVRRMQYSLEIKAPKIHSTAFGDKTRITELSEKGVKIINYSKGLPLILGKVLSITQKIENTPDVLFVVSAGNDGKDASGNTPATLGDELDNVITVGAVNNNDERAIFPFPDVGSSFGTAVNISAPGLNIYAPSFFAEPLSLDDYQFFGGTSAAAPLVTGTAGLLKSINPSLTPAEIKQILIRTADPITTDQPIGGRLNAFRAVCDADVLNCAPEIEAVRQGFNQNTLPPNDDGSTGLIPLGFTANFYGIPRASLYVNNNGNLTFNAPLSAYTPPPLNTLGRDIIAPFFADVDTRSGAVASYGEGFVNGRRAFGITWPGVGCFNQNTSVKNIFQVVLSDRSDTGVENFDIEFNYDMIEWESGQASDGDTACKGGIAARAGFASASGTAEDSFELPGSGIIGALLDLNAETGLIHGSRGSSQSGRYVFPFRGGRI